VNPKSLPFALLVILLVIPPLRAATPEYRGPDAGLVVYSVGTINIAMNFTFKYKRVRLASGEAVSDQRGTIECKCVGFVRATMANADFSGHETGKVVVRSLPPGHYEIYDFGFAGSMGPMTVQSSSKRFCPATFTDCHRAHRPL